jgi:hypothetical protein
MLSKAEIQYLQGQKQVSKSYERKLKCLIKKKIDSLQKELPLLSKLFGDNIESVFSQCASEKEELPQLSNKEYGNQLRLAQYPVSEKAATEFSNGTYSKVKSRDDEFGEGEGLEGLKRSSNLQKIEEATEFSNPTNTEATKNSNLISNSAGRGI